MVVLKTLPIYLALLVIDSVLADNGGLVTRALRSARKTAQSHTKRLASDLRVAFGAVLVDQNGASLDDTRRVVYCKSAGGGLSTGGGVSQGNGTTSGTTTTTGSGSSGTGAPKPPKTSSNATSSQFKLVDSHAGTDFFNGWSFWSGLPDPTNGIVNYVDQSTGRANGIVDVNDAGNAIMRVETTDTVANNRMSIRITTQKTYNGGLFILDAVHMPTGCGTWPAWWTNGPNWPAGGEIDIVEGVGDYISNQATIHTNPGCQLTTGSASQLGITGAIVGGTNCAAAQTGNQGCGVRSSSRVSFGAAFNNNGGGVYAMSWTSDGIAVYFFERDSIPDDITNGAPVPDNWGQPMALWPADACDPFKYFHDHSVIFDTTLCGDWAGAVWGSSGIPGQEQSCAARTGYSTCEAFVRANGASFKEAYWEVRSVKIYQEN